MTANAGVPDQESVCLARVAGQLREVDCLTGWARTDAIGTLMLNTFFSGSLANWRARSRERNHSLRKLAAHPECPLRKSALAEALAVHVFAVEEPQIRCLPGISPAHVAVALRSGPVAALELLVRASNQGWSVRELVRELAARAAEPTPERIANRLAASLHNVERRLRALLPQLDEPQTWIRLDEEQAALATEGISSQLAALERVLAATQPRETSRSEIREAKSKPRQ